MSARAACAIWPECRRRFLEVANSAILLPLNLPPGPSHRLTGAGQTTPLVQSAKSTYGGGGVRTSAPTGAHWIVHFPQGTRLARGRTTPMLGVRRGTYGGSQHQAHVFRTTRNYFRTFPRASGWRGRGGRITLMHRASGSTYRGGVLGQPARTAKPMRGMTLLEPSQPPPKAMPSAKALPPRRRPPGGMAGAQALTLPG